MRWISALELEQWADRIGAREAFPELVRDLILASAKDISDVRFPGGDKGQVRGFDGWLEAAGAPPWVPPGRSIWEFGVSGNPKDKFESDYAKRVDKLAVGDRAAMTFVFATPRTWDNPRKTLPELVEAYRAKQDFADVKYFDGIKLETWLQQCSAVAARHARAVLGRVPQSGARSTDEFWEEYARRFHPALTEEVVLCARSSQANQIVTHLLGKPGAIVFMGDGPDEVSAVAVAAIRKASAESRAYLEARTLVVDTEEAGRALAAPDRYGFVVSPGANKISGLLSTFGPTVSGLGLNPSHHKYPRLERPSTRDMTGALRTMGLTEQDAARLALKSGRSLSILERHAPAAAFDPPLWVTQGKTLIPALLAGGWDSRHDGDKSVLALLAGADNYHNAEASWRDFLDRHDSPLDREAGIWKLRAPVDVFVNLSRLLGAEHLILLETVATQIFSAPPPEAGEERYSAAKAPFSSWLREGVANTLLMMAALHDEVSLDVGRDPVGFVNAVVAGLPGLSDDYRVILALERQLPLLMEAAPDPLLSALERVLEGDRVTLVPLFAETPDFGGSRSNLPHLLWALEMLAWDPQYLLRTSRVLAKLAAIDPGGRSGNRPINSLRDIFVAWSPGTNAPLSSRISVIDALVEQFPAVGWKLLVELLPNSRDFKNPTQQPRFREAGASSRELLTDRLVVDAYDAIIDRMLSVLGETAERWTAVLDAFPSFSPDRRGQFLDLLEDRVEHITGEDKVALRRAVRRIADRHARFRAASWSLPDGDLVRLNGIARSLESADLLEQAIALFDDWWPHDAADYADAERQRSIARQHAVARLVSTKGPAAVGDLASHVKHPQLVATAAVEGIADENVLVDILVQAVTQPDKETFSTALAGAVRWTRGEDFDTRFMAIAKAKGWSNETVSVLLLNWPEVPLTWQLVETLGQAGKETFWQRREPRWFKGPAEQLAMLIGHFLDAGRAGAALQVLHRRENELPWPTISRILALHVEELNTKGVGHQLDGYYIEELFKAIRGRKDVGRMEIAQWEYVYFPALDRRGEDLVLYECMASDPELFVSILKDVFVEDGANADEHATTDAQRARANAGYRLLIAFDRAPGQRDGTVDRQDLDRWVDGMIEEARKARRMSVVYSYIGRSLAHSAENDGLWPQIAIAEVLERLKSSDVEHGLAIERFNMRGVYTKAMYEGGKQERALAQQYRDWAARQPSAHVRTRALLNAIANDWEREAKEADDAAKRDKLRFD